MSKSAVDHIDVRWRVTGTQAWSAPKPYPPTAEIAVDGLERNKQYDFEARSVSACGAMSVWVPSNYTVPDAPVGTLTLVGMQQNIQDASSAAAAANAQLADIASDNVLIPSEKAIVIRDYSVILNDHAGIDAQADAYGIVTEKGAYDDAISALTAYLAGLTTPKAWNDVSGNTNVDGPTFRGKFADVYSAEQVLLNKIYATAKYYADNAQSSANRVALSNPSFESNLTNGPQNTYIQSGALVDDWVVGENTGHFNMGVVSNGRIRTGGWSLRINPISGTSIPSGANAFAGVWTRTNFPCSAGDWFTVGGYVYRDASQSQPAGLNILLLVLLRWFDANGNYLGQGGPSLGGIGGSMSTPVLKNIVAPAGAASYKVYCQVLWGNVTGAAVTVSSAWMGASFDDLFVKRIPDIGIAGSGQQLGDQRNAPSSLTANLGMVRSATALTAKAGGSVDVNAHTIQLGSATVSYNAVPNAVTGLSTGVGYYIYTNDNYAGGTQTWNATTSASVANNADGRYNAGYVTIPSSGSSGGGGAGGPGGGGCVCADMWLRRGLTARALAQRWRWWKPWLWFLRGPDGWHLIRRRPRIVQEPCVRATVADGSWIDCSIHTPVDTHSGESVQAPMLYAHGVASDSGWQRVIEVDSLPGLRDVVRICIGGHSFFAGANPCFRIGTHNIWKN